MVHLAVIQTLFAQQSSPPPGAGMTQVLFLGLMFAAMYFLMIAPQRKKQKELQPFRIWMTERMRARLHHGVAVEAGKGFQAAQV